MFVKASFQHDRAKPMEAQSRDFSICAFSIYKMKRRYLTFGD
jgi:hypothetical protein